MLTRLAAWGDASRGLSAVHSGNMGDIIYALPACRRMGVDHLILNCCVDTALSGRRLTQANARFIAPLLLAQPWLRRVEIAEVPVALGTSKEPSIQGLPLENLEPAAIGVDLILDRFRYANMTRTHLVDSHAAALNTTVNADEPWLASPARNGGGGDTVVVALTGRYRDRPTRHFVQLLQDGPEVIKVGGPDEASLMAEIPGRFVTCRDAGELASLIAQAKAFVGNPSLPYAIAEGLKVPRLVDVPATPLNAYPRGVGGWLLPHDTADARDVFHTRILRHPTRNTPRLRSPQPETPAITLGVYRDHGAGFQDKDSSWSIPRPAEPYVRAELPFGEAPLNRLRLDVRTRVHALCLSTINLHDAEGRLIWSLAAAGPGLLRPDAEMNGLRTAPFVTDTGLWLTPNAPHAWFELTLPAEVLWDGAGGWMSLEAWVPKLHQAAPNLLVGLSLKDSAHEKARQQLSTMTDRLQKYQDEIAVREDQMTDQLQKYQDEIAVREDHLKNIYGSRSWRLTRPLRAVALARRDPARFRRRAAEWLLRQRYGQTPLHRLLRRVNRRTGLARVVFTRLLGPSQAGPPRFTGNSNPPTLAAGATCGFLAGRGLRDDETVTAGATLTDADIAQYQSGTQRILRRYNPPPERPAGEQRRWLPVAEFKAHLSSRAAREDRLASDPAATLSVITPFFRHIEYFAACARSMADLVEAHADAGLAGTLEWIVLNDDPDVSERQLRDALPTEVAPITRVCSDGANLGIARRLNEGASAATGAWLLFLDCDDCIDPQASMILRAYIGRFPQCRLISSTMTDMNEDGEPLRRRLRSRGIEALVDEGMIAGHLMAVRADLFGELGGFDPTRTGCQDYDLAIRTAMTEAILLIPESLYFYRWHGQTQSLSNARRQAQVAERIRHAAFSRFVQPAPVKRGAAAHVVSHGLCAIRTQGRRLDLLTETITSAHAQSVPVTPFVVVHGDAARYEAVRAYLSEEAPDALVTHAAATERCRGHPINIALDALTRAPQTYGFFCILDDDDIYYPGFAARLLAALHKGADIAYCGSNAREPWQPATQGHAPLPAPALLADNFIPTNAFAVRADFLRTTGCRMREDLEYLEDWDFLLQLLCAGAYFAPVYETLSEYRVIGDGNRTKKTDQRLWDTCARDAAHRAEEAARALGPEGMARAVLAFDFARRPPLSEKESRLMDMTAAMLDRYRSGEDRHAA